jgi:hypothetical protein
MMSASSEANLKRDPWAEHYRAASARRRARGWHRRDEVRPRHRRAARRARFYVLATLAFVAATAVALLLPR